MQVESTLMNVGDGGPVSREISALSKASTSMVGNPPQTLPPEFRGDVNLSQQNKTTSTKDCKVLKACLDSSNGNNSPEISLPQQPNNAPMSSPVIASLEKGTDKRTKTSKVRSDGSGVFPAPQWSASREDSLNSCHSSVTPSKKSHPQTQSLQSLAPGLQCSAMFKPAQPVAFLPSTNFSPQLCKITLPPALGQIAALREATGNQFQKETQGSDVGGKSLMRTYPYSLSVGRTSDQKEAGSNLKLKSNHSSSKTTKSLEHKSLASVVASPSIPLPLQHPSSTAAGPTHYTLSPTAAICCGSALASITSQSRLLNHLEKANCVDKTAMGPLNAMEDHTACSNEQRDVPLDLSAKSKRPKCATDAHASTIEPHSESSQRDFLNAKRTSAYCSNTQYPVLPNSHRNGSHQKQLNRTQNHQITESKGTWGQGNLQDSIKSITGTYVGVASPILASTLRGKDGKGSFADEFQNFAKQEFISIIDQGEHLASGRKKPSCLVKGNQNAHSGKHVKNTNSALTKNCPAKGALSAALLSSAGVGSQSKCGPKSAVPHSATVVSPSWQPPLHLPHQPLQRKIPHVSSKTRDSAVTEGSKFQSPSKPEDNKWEKKKSPLSKLASIVQQQGIETAALTNEGGTQALPGAGKDVQSKHAAKFEYPPYWGVEKWPCKTESIQVTKRNETLNAAELSEYNAAGHRNKGEHVGLQAKQVCSDPSGQTPPFGSNASTNGNRIESKLAQVLEGEISKKESRTSNSTESENSEAMVASILTDQCKGRRDKPGKTANGTKDEPPTKAKVATIEQKKNSPKKPAKEKPPAEPLKKVAAKKKQDNEKTPVKVPINKKPKKQSAPASGQNLSADELSPHKKEPNRKDNISLSGAEQATRAKTDKSVPLSGDNLVSPNNSTLSNKELDTTDSSFPRLRRGQRRADDARLDLWGFATPSPPPPPMLPKDVSPSPPTTPNQPARRPRGRPRSNAPHERTLEGKGRTPGAEADTTPHRKRRRCSSKKYETGEYITEKDKLEEGDSLRQDTETPADPQRDDCASPAAPSPEPPPPPKPSYTRSGSVRYQESDDSECNSKPSGKRKFKSKHLSDGEEPRSKTRRGSSGKRGTSLPLDDDSPDAKPQITPPAPPKSLPSSPTAKKISSGRNSGSDSSPKRPVPPEVRRLIVNKNAGETLLQRAARLGYQDVVQYCLDKDSGEVNRRDNAGYTALHEASSRGWTQIVQILLKHGADVNCSAQDGTRPLHDAVASDNLPIVWLLLNHGADPTLATYSGHTPVKLAHSQSMKAFLTEYFSDLEGRCERDPSLPWDFYSSCLFETDQEACWDFLLSEENHEPEDEETKPERELDKDSLLFEFSSEPLLPCYHVQVSLTQGFCNWFLLSDVLKRLKMSSRIFRARYPHFEVVSLSQAELWRQVSVSQVSSALASPQKGKNKDNEKEDEDEEEGPVELVCCVPELQRLLGSSVHILQEEDEDEEETVTPTGKSRSR